MKDSQTDLLEHSRQKVKLLEAYLSAYFPVIAHDGHTEEIQITDVFCGEGMFPNGKVGSPLVFGRMAAALLAENPRAPRIKFRFNDGVSAKVDRVRDHLAPLEAKHDRLTLLPSNESYEDLLPILLEEKRRMTRHHKGFYFIDPYGYSAVSPRHIQQLLEGRNTEVLLFQPSSFLHRFAERGTPQALDRFMTELSGGVSWPEGLSVRQRIQYTKELFQKLIGDDFFVDSFTIQKDASNVFCLFFFTPHIRGFEKMLEAKWKLNESTGQGWHFSQSADHDDLFSTVDPQTKALERHLLDGLQRTGGMTNEEIYRTTLRQSFLPKHATELLRNWQRQGRLVVDPVSTRKGAFYLGYKSHVNEGRIVRISVIPSRHGS
jgi:three-Cys-motif partner protein